MSQEIDAVRRRLEAAERVCVMFGITAARGETDRDKALHRMWSDWSQEYARDAPPRPSDAQIERLAHHYDQIRDATLARIRGAG